MDAINGVAGVFWISAGVVLAGVAVGGSLRARRHGRVPQEWTTWLATTVFMAASPFLVLWMLDSLVASGFENNESEQVPLPVPDWLFADSTALIAGIVAAVGILASIICFLIRGQMQHMESVAVDEALLREMRGESNDT